MPLSAHHVEGVSKVHETSHRICYHQWRGFNLIHAWTKGYLAKGQRGTNQYLCVSAWRNWISSHGDQTVGEGLEKNPNNFAFYLSAGSSFLPYDAKQHHAIEQFIAHLRKAYSMWKHPLVLIMMARVLAFDRYNLRSLRESLQIWKELQANSLMEIVQYLPNAPMRRNRMHYEREMRWDITMEMAKCYNSLGRNRKKMRYLKCSLNLYEILRSNFIGNGCRHSDHVIWEGINLCTNQIRLLFWSGDYHSAYRSVVDLMTLCSRKRLKLDVCSARICYVVFMKLQKFNEWDRALKQQSRKGLRSRVSLDAKKIEWELLLDDIYRTYLASCGIEQGISFKKLYENVAHRYSEKKDFIDDGVDSCWNASGVEPFLAIFEFQYEWHYDTPLLGGYWKFFKDASAYHVRRYVFCDGLLNECHEPLCVGMEVHYSFFTEYIHYKVQHYKLAHPLYQFYHEINPFDPVAYQHHGLLMQSVGKMKRAEKYFERARTLNIKSKLDLDSIRTADVELDTRDHCAECGKKDKGFRRCGRCKVMLYCSRKCQKLNWKRGHRNQCNHYEHNELKAAFKLIPFFFRE